MNTVIVNNQKIELGDWLENTDNNKFSRYAIYAIGQEESIWICNECGQSDGVDPYEDYCPNCTEYEDYCPNCTE